VRIYSSGTRVPNVRGINIDCEAALDSFLSAAPPRDRLLIRSVSAFTVAGVQ
jgi:hypothetical protein